MLKENCSAFSLVKEELLIKLREEFWKEALSSVYLRASTQWWRISFQQQCSVICYQTQQWSDWWRRNTTNWCTALNDLVHLQLMWFHYCMVCWFASLKKTKKLYYRVSHKIKKPALGILQNEHVVIDLQR